MGNSLRSKKTTKIMKIDGETMKLKTPVKAEEVTKDFPGFVLLDSESVKHYGVRAKPLQPLQNLEPKRLYFLVELPREFPTRRVKSEIHMTAQEKLERLMLARRSVSDLSVMKSAGNWTEKEIIEQDSGAMRVKVRVRKSEMEKALNESENESETAKKIVSLCMDKSENHSGAGNSRGDRGSATRAREKRVSFIAMAPKEAPNEISCAS